MALAICLVTASAFDADAAKLLTETQARAKAIKVLMDMAKEEPFLGRTREAASAHIKDVTLVSSGQTECDKITRPVWRVHIVVPADSNSKPTRDPVNGYLTFDARTGAYICVGPSAD
jgi:hypothetical protein